MIRKVGSIEMSRVLDTAALLETTASAVSLTYGSDVAYSGLVYATLAVAMRSKSKEAIFEHISRAIDDIEKAGGSKEMDRILRRIADFRMAGAAPRMTDEPHGQAEQN